VHLIASEIALNTFSVPLVKTDSAKGLAFFGAYWYLVEVKGFTPCSLTYAKRQGSQGE
jgi:hypothetical protein